MIRDAVPGDEGTLAGIAATSIPNRAHHWTTADFIDSVSDPATIVLSDGTSGFLVLRVAGDETEVIDLAVRPETRQRGVGRALVEAAVVRATAAGARTMFLEVAVGNRAARSLYNSTGFQEVGERRGYYRHSDGSLEDALILRRDLILPVAPHGAAQGERPETS